MANLQSITYGDSVFGIPKSVELTQAEYDALTDEEKNNGTTYFITDGQGGGGGGASSLQAMYDANQDNLIVETDGPCNLALRNPTFDRVTSIGKGGIRITSDDDIFSMGMASGEFVQMSDATRDSFNKALHNEGIENSDRTFWKYIEYNNGSVEVFFAEPNVSCTFDSPHGVLFTTGDLFEFYPNLIKPLVNGKTCIGAYISVVGQGGSVIGFISSVDDTSVTYNVLSPIQTTSVTNYNVYIHLVFK